MVDLIESMEEQLLTLQGSDGIAYVCRMLGLFPYEGKQYALLLNLGEQGVGGEHRIADPTSDEIPVFLNPADANPALLEDLDTLDQMADEGKVLFVENDLPVRVEGPVEVAFVEVVVERGPLEGKHLWVSRSHLSKDEPYTTVMEFYVKGVVSSADGWDGVPLFTMPPPVDVLRTQNQGDIQKHIGHGAMMLENGATVLVLGNPNQEGIQVLVKDGAHVNRGGWVASRHLSGETAACKMIEDDDEYDRVRAYVAELAVQMEQEAAEDDQE